MYLAYSKRKFSSCRSLDINPDKSTKSNTPDIEDVRKLTMERLRKEVKHLGNENQKLKAQIKEKPSRGTASQSICEDFKNKIQKLNETIRAYETEIANIKTNNNNTVDDTCVYDINKLKSGVVELRLLKHELEDQLELQKLKFSEAIQEHQINKALAQVINNAESNTKHKSLERLLNLTDNVIKAFIRHNKCYKSNFMECEKTKMIDRVICTKFDKIVNLIED